MACAAPRRTWSRSATRATRSPGLPEVSLYGTTFASLSPTPAHLAQIDVLVFDIQDVGARYYTYAATMALCMRAAGQAGVKVVVLDRPNPIGGLQVEGGGLEPGLENFCGLYPVPQRHAMTVGELARLYNVTFDIACELDVVAVRGLARAPRTTTTCDLPWVMPSPNMPTLDTAIVYPGMCLLEGTNLSEGRGTTRPFELFGAPFIDGRQLAAELERYDLPGVRFRPCVIEPTFHKFAGQRCGAVQLHVTDRRAFNAYRTGLAVLVAVKTLWPDAFAWRTQPYEFRADVPAIDLLTGNAGGARGDRPWRGRRRGRAHRLRRHRAVRRRPRCRAALRLKRRCAQPDQGLFESIRRHSMLSPTLGLNPASFDSTYSPRALTQASLYPLGSFHRPILERVL